MDLYEYHRKRFRLDSKGKMMKVGSYVKDECGYIGLIKSISNGYLGGRIVSSPKGLNDLGTFAITATTHIGWTIISKEEALMEAVANGL